MSYNKRKNHLQVSFNGFYSSLALLILAASTSFAQNAIFYGGSGSGGSKICTPLPIILPIQLVDFSARCTDGLITTQWTIASENNCREYRIEFTTDGNTWQIADIVDAVGNTSFETTYNKDLLIPGFLSYYLRLCHVDYDGNDQCFEIISVQNCNDNGQTVVFPNPSSGELNVLVPDGMEHTMLEIVNALGQVVFSDSTEDNGPMNYSLNQLPAGIYQLKLIYGEQIVLITSWVKI